MIQEPGRRQAPFDAPEKHLPAHVATKADEVFLQALVSGIRSGACIGNAIQQLFGRTSFPQEYVRLTLILYAPGKRRILVSRGGEAAKKAFSFVFQRLLRHPRRQELTTRPFRLQMDFVVDSPVRVDFYQLRMRHGHELHFEIGVDGLEYLGPDGKLHLFLPGDAYVRSIMSMGQLRAYLHRVHGEEYVRKSVFRRFRSLSFISSVKSGEGSWLRLYRGHPVVGELTRVKLVDAVNLAIAHIQLTQEQGGKYLYYYDAAQDSRWDHEHPHRDPRKNPYYNILRHCGGALTCLFYEKYTRTGQTLENVRRAVEYLLEQTRLQDYQGREGGFVYSEKKGKLGGSAIALYMLAEYQLLTGDDRYQTWADRLAWHLVNQVTAGGEFIYYNIYLDKPVTEEDNQKYFSFYYPGEAVCGLARYLHLAAPGDRELIFERLRKALDFLLKVRPKTRASEYTALPSDSWLMMGIKELWDFPEMRDPSYADFVVADARKMVQLMYTVTDAPCPDYAGAFYYNFGDYPYADGARCEGLLGAYELAVKMGDRAIAAELWPALRLAAWALQHLVNTEDSLYFAPRPDLALGGIRFKYTRQWFRIDTIQHVASFFAKMLSHWDAEEHGLKKF
ncbi:hypothetical protein [Desulfonatronum thioautotrophicum]|uniref:hypothetical protein n=1 Tax=Desulfonatronum thioautotrophicum TaxID=617001 RepID=UPI0005EB205D|nr:hypothetical protein [Desulfonatronum thioautotrophicum]